MLGDLQQIGSPELGPDLQLPFPSQEHKLKVGAQAVDIAVMKRGTIVEIVRMPASSKSSAGQQSPTGLL